jgi:hypothetical protein
MKALIKKLRVFLLLGMLLMGIAPMKSKDKSPVNSPALESRFEHRREDIRITVTNKGQPVKDAVVKVDLKKHEFQFGCMANHLGEDATYDRKFLELFNFSTPGGSASISYAKQQGIGTRAYIGLLTWEYDLPRDEYIQYIRNEIIKKNVNAGAGLIDEFVVMNEASQFNGVTYPHLNNLMNSMGGKAALLKECFAAAREANPDALMLINDVATDYSYYNLLGQLQDADGNSVFDAAGIQSHRWSNSTWDNAKIQNICDHLSAYGKPVYFTEVTIWSTLAGRDPFDTAHPLTTTPEGEEQQRQDVIRFYSELFASPVVESIVWWDFSDKWNWLNAPSGLLREDMSSKPAYDALKQLITEEWATHETLTTGNNGQATTRAFRGTYDFTVTLPDGTTRTITEKVGKGTGEITLAFPVESDGLFVYRNSGSNQSFDLKSVRKLTDTGTDLVVTFKNEATPPVSVPTTDLRFFSLKHFDFTTGISTPVATETVSVYPNPVVADVTVKNAKKITGLVLYNQQGQKLVQLYPETQEATLRLASYPTGLYLLQVADKDGMTIIKIIKK